jgi:hypothetical protein
MTWFGKQGRNGEICPRVGLRELSVEGKGSPKCVWGADWSTKSGYRG